jgi:hypothetical protein
MEEDLVEAKVVLADLRVIQIRVVILRKVLKQAMK